MKTKAEIVQSLLNEGNITAEDAVVLLMNDKDQTKYIFIPQMPYNPVSPYWPYNPYPVYVDRTEPYYYTSNELTVSQN